jgi:D-alanyl-D-alanine carboxypeptidase/D-alanyl-D-alanine-endopeptidase (penicillin-binding protein 4)
MLCAVALAHAGMNAARAQSSSTVHSPASATRLGLADRADLARFRKRVELALDTAGPDKGLWGVLVTDAVSGETYYERNADKFFSPASNAKLFTTAFALATLGPDYRVRTSIESFGAIDGNGRLNGDLALIGRGDANFSNRKFPYDKKAEREGPPEKALADFADAVAARGVKEIGGDVVADDSLFQPERFPSGWTIDDMLWSYGAAVSAIAVNDNMFTLELWPGENENDFARFDAGLAADFYTVENAVRTSARGTVEQLAVARDPGSLVIRVSGTMPEGGAPRKLSIAVEAPAEYAAKLLARLLEMRGIKVDGRPRARHAGDASLDGGPAMPPIVLAERTSPPLADDIVFTNKESENLHAELLLLLAAHEKAGASNYEDALKFESGFFSTAGIGTGDVVLSDGSGLSRKDLVTPRSVVRVLRYASTQPWGELYRASLPLAGEDGTLSERMKNTPAAGHVFAKTGTIGHINALSGYATTVRGTQLQFSILGNNNGLHAQDANRVIDAIVVAMVEELGASEQTKKRR